MSDLSADEIILIRETLNRLHQRTFDPDKDARIKVLWEKLRPREQGIVAGDPENVVQQRTEGDSLSWDLI
jgi:hypothetical protein